MFEARRRFRLIEFCVIAFIVVMALEYLLAWQLSVRATHNRILTQNNIRQIGIGILNYHDGNKERLPLLCDYGEGAVTGHGIYSLFFEILPQMERFGTGIYANYYRNPATYYDGKSGAARVQISVYLDPSDIWEVQHSAGVVSEVEVTDPNATGSFPPNFTGTYATTSYAANGMVFQPNTSLRDIKDGSTNTIMLATRYQVCRTLRDVKVYNLWGFGAYGASTPGFATPLPEGNKYPTGSPALEQFVPNVPVPASGIIEGRTGKTPMRYSNIGHSSKAECGFQDGYLGTSCDPRIPQSFHRGVLIVGLGDASARVISYKISPHTFWATVTPAGNETLGADW